MAAISVNPTSAIFERIRTKRKKMSKTNKGIAEARNKLHIIRRSISS
jgi:hypothetical protein